MTAKHVFFDKDSKLKFKTAKVVSYSKTSLNPDKFEFSFNLDSFLQSNELLSHKNQDITIIRFATCNILPNNIVQYGYVNDKVIKLSKLKTDLPLVPMSLLAKYQDVNIGDDVFVVGYPSSIGIANIPQIDYEQPLIKKGIIAGRNLKQNTLILDCATYFGNSGGPVVEILHQNGIIVGYKLIGLVSQYIPFVDIWENRLKKISNVTETNSGYSVVVPLDGLFELLAHTK